MYNENAEMLGYSFIIGFVLRALVAFLYIKKSIDEIISVY